METKEIKTLLRTNLESILSKTFAQYGFKWKKSSCKFQRKMEDFEQSILFFFSPAKLFDDKSLGHIDIMIRLDSKEINKLATILKGAETKFDSIETVVNVNVGLIFGKKAINWKPISIEEMNRLIETDIKSLLVEKIVPFLNDRGNIRKVLNDFENTEPYFFSNSNDVVALLAITMYSMLNDHESARKVAAKYYLPDEIYRKKYKTLLHQLNCI